MTYQSQVEEPNRVAIALCTAAGLCLGVYPYLVYVERSPALLVYFPIAALVGRFSLRRLAARATEKPGADEFLVAGWNAAFHGSAVSLCALFIHLMASLLGWTGAVLGFWTAAGARGGATMTSLVVAALVALGMAAVAPTDIGEKLYPSTAGARSPYLELILERRSLGMLLLVSLLGVLGARVAFTPGGLLFSVVSLLFVLLPATSIENFEKRPPQNPEKDRGVRALVKLLGAAGFETISSPRTGRPDVDPLLTSVDLLARKARHALVIEVKAPTAETAAVEWHEGSRLQTAAWSLEETLRAEGIGTVEPLLVLCGRTASAGLETYAREHDLRLLVEDADLVELVEATEDPVELQALAGRHLGLPRLPTEERT